MAITKQVETSQMTVLSDGQIHVQEKTTIFEDGVELSHSFHREVLDPATDAGGVDSRGKPRDPRVLAMVAHVHTPAVKQARVDFLATQE